MESFNKQISIIVLFAFIFSFIIPVEALAQEQPAYIQIKCPPGIKFYLDGTYKGISTSELGGFFITDVSPGTHSLRAEKDGYVSQTDKVFLVSGQVLVYNLKPFTQEVTVKQYGEEKSSDIQQANGIIIIQSLPIECTISIPLLSVSNTSKTRDKWQAENVKVDYYTFTATALSKTIQGSFRVERDSKTEIFVNFTTGKYDVNITPQHNIDVSKVSTESPVEKKDNWMNTCIGNTVVIALVLLIIWGVVEANKKNQEENMY